ncbi:MAG: hypothetical protein ACRD1R_19565 [Acidobacteriota bacterium]
MERCPTCGARLGDEPLCRRCQTDLTEIRSIERLAVRNQRLSLSALESGRLEEAHRHARHAVELYRSPESLKAMALACLASRRFSAAIALWLELANESRG